MPRLYALTVVIIIAAVLLLLAAVMTNIISPAKAAHWHSGNTHGSYDGSPLNQEECEALFGGPGWE